MADTTDNSVVQVKDTQGNVIQLKPQKPKQLGLFGHFLPDNGHYSNTIELYDAIPKYYLNKRSLKTKRKNGQYLETLERTFQHKGQDYKVLIAPARLQDENNQDKEYYPGPREELVEDALRKLTSDRLNGVYLDNDVGVQFTLYELKEELTRNGHSISLNDLKKSLEICKNTTIKIFSINGDDECILHANIFQVLAISTRKDWLKNPKKARCYVKFNPLVTKSVNTLTYRQFDYTKYMAYKHRLTRWFHKRLFHNFTQAGIGQTFNIRLSTIMRDSGMHIYKNNSKNVGEVEKALNELQKFGVISEYEKEESRGAKNKILEVKYTLYPSAYLIDEICKSNQRVQKIVRLNQDSQI
jgi:hypothetical protein